MPTNFPNGVTSQGIPLLPDIPVSTGTYYFVHSGVGSNNYTGLSTIKPFATLQKALDTCTASKGDVVLVMPGHAETVTATSLLFNKAGVRVVGVGNGLLRPTFTYGAAAATITVSAANMSIENCVFSANFADVLSAFTMSTTCKDFWVTDNDFIDVDATHNFVSIVTTGATANAADGLTVVRCFWWSLATGTSLAFVSILGVTDRVYLGFNHVDMASTTDIGHFLTSTTFAQLGLRVEYNCLNVIGSTGAAAGLFYTSTVQATTSGYLAFNMVGSLDATTPLLDTATAGSQLGHFENYITGSAADKSGILLPAADNPA